MDRLDPRQEQLLNLIVEAARNVEEPQPFLTFHPAGTWESTVIHTGLSGGKAACYESDLDELAAWGLLRMSRDGHSIRFDPTSHAFTYYRGLHENGGVQEVEKTLTSFVDSARLRNAYPGAIEAWEKANEALWSESAERKGTEVGHWCREAMQAFADAVAAAHKVDAEPDRAKTVNRIAAVLDAQRDTLGRTRLAFLDALLDYWRKANDLVQRQEHGAAREPDESFIWEDSRRVVFQTLIVMYEIDRATNLSR